MAALELLIDYGVERAREICEAEEELEAPKTAVDGLARFAGEQGRKLFTLPRPLPPPLERLRFASCRGPEAATEWVAAFAAQSLTRRCSRSRFQPQTGNRRRFGAEIPAIDAQPHCAARAWRQARHF